ncbi:hypothetical protein [Bacillus cereus]
MLKKKITSTKLKKLLEKNMTNTISGFENRNNGEKLDTKLSYVIQKQRIMFINEKKKSYRKILNLIYKINKNYDMMKVTKYF